MSERFLRSAEGFLSQRANVIKIVSELRSNPEFFNTLQTEFDGIVNSFNDPLTWTGENPIYPRNLTPNALKLRELLNGQKLPALEQLETDQSGETKIACRDTFRKINIYMKNGEEDREGMQWHFHRSFSDSKNLATEGLFEIYGEFISHAFPELKREAHAVVTALEEMLAIFHKDTGLFQRVKKYYTEKEGFSPTLIAMINE
ncbi:MAG: hypothetical protein ABH816_01585 [Candidatus Levyibacteriota bacterium]